MSDEYFRLFSNKYSINMFLRIMSNDSLYGEIDPCLPVVLLTIINIESHYTVQVYRYQIKRLAFNKPTLRIVRQASPDSEMNRRLPVALPTASPLQPLINIFSLVRVLLARKAGFDVCFILWIFCGEPVDTSDPFQDSC